MEPIILTIMIMVLLILFISERWPAEISALVVVFALVVLTEFDFGFGWHFLEAKQAVMGVANEAVITVAAMFVISAGLVRTGVVAYLGDKIIALSKGNSFRVLLLSVLTVAISSSFINNTPVVVLFVPLILRVCFRYSLSPSKYLIPISYASILGGTTTLIGTSTNILISNVAVEIGAKHPEYHIHQFGMFEIFPVGIVVAIGGIALIFLFGRKLLPDRKTVTSTLAGIEQKSFMTELEIQKNSPCVGKTVSDAFLSCYKGLNVLEVIRNEEVMYPPVENVVLREQDILLTKGTAGDIIKIQQDQTAIIAPELGPDAVRITEQRNFTLAEVVILPGSRFVGGTIDDAQFKRRYGVNVIAILRKGRHMHIQAKIRKVDLAVGDTLLVQGGEEAISRMRDAGEILLLEGIGETIIMREKAPIALSVLLGVVVGASLNILPIMVLAVVGALIMIITQCVTLQGAYKSLDGSVLLLIAGTIALGSALENTGTARIYGDYLVSAASPLGMSAVLAALFLLTSLLTHFISNNATAVLMTHVAVATAAGLGYEPLPFIMAVLFGASACFATPIGYQTNLFVYGPGGYKFLDYAKLGMPINLMVMVVTTILIPLIWPFRAMQ